MFTLSNSSVGIVFCFFFISFIHIIICVYDLLTSFICPTRRSHWYIRFIPHTEPDPTIPYNEDWVQIELGDLQPRQLYAYYVHAQVVSHNETQSRSAVHGLSPMRYFTSATRRPLPPFVYTTAKTRNSITVSWFHPAWDTAHYVESYVVDLHHLPDDLERLQNGRNYCLDPKEVTPPRIVAYANFTEPAFECCERLLTNQHARFVTAHIGLDGDPDACGPQDHHCRSEAEFHVLMANESWYTESPGRLAAVRAEELPFMMLAPPEPDDELAQSHRNVTEGQEAANLVQSHRVDSLSHSFRFENLTSFERYAVRVYSCTNVSVDFFH